MTMFGRSTDFNVAVSRCGSLRLGEARERGEVGGRLTAVLPPGPFTPNARREAELDRGVERLVGIGEHAAEQPVDLVTGEAFERHATDEVHVPELVHGEVDAVH